MTEPRITLRLAREDRGLVPSHIYEEALRRFVERLPSDPEASYPIKSLLKYRPCFSFHSARYRGATWHDEEQDVEWLIALRVHREDSEEDAYSAFESLAAAGRLFPTSDDYRALEQTRRTERLLLVSRELAHVRDEALHAPGQTFRYDAHGIYAELETEVIPELSLLRLRVRLTSSDGTYLSGPDLAVVLVEPFRDEPPEEIEDPDPRHFRRFEGFV